MRPPSPSPILRLRVQPDDTAGFAAPRPRGSRRPHTDAVVAAVRRLIEESVLTYAQISARTGVGRASICRWTRDQGWKRPPFAPRATDTVPTARASRRLRMRTLAARLSTLAERYVRELEETPGVDLEKLAEALELMKMAKLAAHTKRRWLFSVRGLAAAGVNPNRAPKAAVDDFVSSDELPPDDHPALRTRGVRRR
jgi:hypothetical protein